MEISEKNNSNQEIDLISFSNNDAIYIRKQLQLENEELYYLYVYIIAFDKNKEELNKTMNCVENILVSSGMQCKKAYFREEQVFLSCLPIMYNHIDIKNVAKRNVLTSRFNFNFSFYVLICL